jgi:hypothetical protein
MVTAAGRRVVFHLRHAYPPVFCIFDAVLSKGYGLRSSRRDDLTYFGLPFKLPGLIVL